MRFLLLLTTLLTTLLAACATHPSDLYSPHLKVKDKAVKPLQPQDRTKHPRELHDSRDFRYAPLPQPYVPRPQPYVPPRDLPIRPLSLLRIRH